MGAGSNEQIVRTTCGLCKGGCGAIVHLHDGSVGGIEGDPQHPVNKGTLCARGLASLERLCHPDRLPYPLRRTGERGEGEWQRISWDEALDTIAENLTGLKNKYGAEAVAFWRGASRGMLQDGFIGRFANVFGTPNRVEPAHVCHVPRVMATRTTCGFWPSVDYEYPPGCIIVWGCNPYETRTFKVPQIQQAVDRGAKLIVIDPRGAGFAREANLWLRLRPGTDLALALGMIKVIIDEALYDTDFVDTWCTGFDRLARHVQDYRPDKVEEITWVPAETVIAAARTYATSGRAGIEWSNAIDHGENSFGSARAILILSALTGNMGKPGGDVQWKMIPHVSTQSPEFTLTQELSPKQRKKKIGAKLNLIPIFEYVPTQLINRAILEEDPYPIRGVYLEAGNPLLTNANAQDTFRAWSKLDFIVAADMFTTPSCELADIVLPVSSYLEFDSISAPADGSVLSVQQKVAQVGECWPDHKILNELAKRMGLEKYFWNEADESLDYILKPSNITFEEFREIVFLGSAKDYRKYEADRFMTPSGKVEIYSNQLQEWGKDPLPTYHEPAETPYSDPALAREYPLLLTSYKPQQFRHASDKNIRTLREAHPEPIVEIHPETAKQLGIGDGDMVHIENKRGRIKQKARLSTDIDPRVVYADYGWWFPERGLPGLYGWDESNINVLVNNQPPYNAETGSTNLRGVMCKVYKIN